MSEQGGDTRIELMFRLEAALKRIEALEAEAEEHGHQVYAYANRLEEVDNAMVDAIALIKAKAARIEALEAALGMIILSSKDGASIEIVRAALAPEKK